MWYKKTSTRQGEHAMQIHRRRQFDSRAQAQLNQEKLALARQLVGKKVVIDGVVRAVTGCSELTGEAEVRMGLRTQAYDPRMLVVVESTQG